MRFRTGAVIGFGVGYYYGAKAGRERYRELEAYLERVRGNETYQQTRDKVLAVADKGAARARQVVEERLPGGAGGAGTGADTTIDLDDRTPEASAAVP